jgi:hypothetical protein
MVKYKLTAVPVTRASVFEADAAIDEQTAG